MIRASRPLALDFRAARPGSHWMAWVLAAAAVTFSADVSMSYYRAREAVTADEAGLARLERSARGQLNGARTTPEEIAQARETYLRLTTPWNELFGALESASSEKVVLVAIEPDPKAGTVLVSGEAGDFPAVLEYVAGLQRAKTLGRVHLVRHEVRQNERERPVAFTVSASWSEVKQ